MQQDSTNSETPDSNSASRRFTVLFSCTCGNQLLLNPATGGTCERCEKLISPKQLELDLGTTVALDDGSFKLDQTYPLGQIPEFNGAANFSIESADELTGAMFGHFKLISPIGRGGMGQVYRALDTSLQRFAAVKLLRSGIESPNGSGGHQSTPGQTPTAPKSSEKEIETLLQEAISQARVTHPNIVTIYYVGKQDGNPFLAMELINGSPLSNRLREDDMSFDEVVSVALDITNALDFSYDLDIIHGDIKPSNVLITKNGTAKLSDFGMARSASEQTGASVGGTPNYIAPEILKGEPPSLQSDIYSLGVTLFESTFKSLPRVLRGRSIKKWIESIESEDIVFPTSWPPRLPEQWRTVLQKMLATNPDERYQSYGDLLLALKQIQPISEVPARLLPRLVAAGFDWATVLVLAVVVQVALSNPLLLPVTTVHPYFVFLLKACVFLPFFVYSFIVYFWRQSIGRNLMHIQVVNQYGMKPSRRAMAIRSAMRMQFPFIIMCRTLFFDSRTADSLEIVIAGLVLLSLIFLLIELVSMISRKLSLSIHDLVARTRVVLDTQQA